MRTDLYHVISAASEDRFGETASLEEALRLARRVAGEERSGEAVCIEHRGLVIRQLRLGPDGRLEETVLA